MFYLVAWNVLFASTGNINSRCKKIENLFFPFLIYNASEPSKSNDFFIEIKYFNKAYFIKGVSRTLLKFFYEAVKNFLLWLLHIFLHALMHNAPKWTNTP